MCENLVRSGDAVIWTIETGEGFPVMLCSGGPGCCVYLGPVAAMIDDAARVIRFEQRGCGRSAPVGPYDLTTCLLDLENIRRYYEIDRWIIGGDSWGADLALIYALEHPKHTAGLVCIAGGRIQNDREWHSAYVRNKEQQNEREPAYLYPPNREVNKQVNAAWKSYVQKPNLLRALALFEPPALFVYAENDIRPAWAAAQVANLLPKARFEIIEGAEHFIWLSRPTGLRSRLRDFVRAINVLESR